jgi:hypothetical protein
MTELERLRNEQRTCMLLWIENCTEYWLRRWMNATRQLKAYQMPYDMADEGFMSLQEIRRDVGV